jgi:hypothetical protein
MPASPAPLLRLALAAAALVAFAPARGAEIDCTMRFSMVGWSIFYKTATGTGTITCSDGKSMAVKVRAKGGGLTVGKSRIEDGQAKFSEVHRIDELLGSYANAEAHIGVTKSGTAQVMTKGEVSLALSGAGQGFDVGIAFGKFVISRP